MYKDEAAWIPQLEEEQILKREPNNEKDENAVAVVRPLPSHVSKRRATELNHSNTADEYEDEILGHIPLRMLTFVIWFLKRFTNKGKVVITGKRVNQGAGYGLEIPCKYIFYGDKQMSIPWLKSINWKVWAMMFLRNSRRCMIFMLQERKDQKKNRRFYSSNRPETIILYNYITLLNVIKYHCYVVLFSAVTQC